MARLFVSTPMQGKGRVEILTEQERALALASKKVGKPLELVKSTLSNHMDMKPLECLGHSLILLSGADYVTFGRGWEDARGCKIEHDCAVAYGIPIIDLDE